MVLKNVDKQRLEDLYRKDLLSWSISNIALGDGKKWELADRKWMIEPYQAVNPYKVFTDPAGEPRKMAVRKSTQAGISTLSIAKALHFMSYWPSRVGYMLPRQADISVFSLTRVDPMISTSPFLLSKLGQPNSTYTKTIGESYLYFLEGSVEPRSIPMDMLLLDEVDLCNPDHVGTAINRLDASTWKMTVWLSTPTLPATGIDAVYESSDKRQWLVPCPHCGHWQDLDWEKNLRYEGPASAPTKVYYGCQKCNREITLPDIQAGAWVAEHPSKTEDMIGYHISQMMTTPARALYAHFRDPNQTLSEFYRKRLGKPYTMAGGSVEREDFLVNCFDEPFMPEKMYDGSSTYYMGVDQGNQLQVIVAKVEKGKKRPKVVHIELVPFDTGFDRVGHLMRLFHVRRCVIDGDPNRHPIKELQKAFPGKVLMADYVEDQRERFKKKMDDRKGSPTYKLPVAVTINRTEGFDDLIASIKDGLWMLPGDPSNLPAEVETLIDQVTALKRDVEKRRTASGEREVGVWRKLRADHLSHAMLYTKTAMDMDHLSNFRMAVVGARKAPGEQPEEQVADGAEKAYAPKQEVITEIVARLAEVPHEQLEEYLQKAGSDGYNPPFPLRVKLKKLLSYSDEDIAWVMNFLLKSWRA